MLRDEACVGGGIAGAEGERITTPGYATRRDVKFAQNTLTAQRRRRTTSGASRSDETLRPERLREVHERAKWDDEELRRAKGARVLRPQSLICSCCNQF